MILAISIAVAIVGFALALFLWSAAANRARQRAKDIVAQEMNKLIDAHNAKIVNLKDPDRSVDPKEVQDALTRVRDLGRKPL